MPFSPILSSFLTFALALLGMAFYTLLERKALGYFQIRKGPNKVGIMGLPQPFADALKLFTKELSQPTMANMYPFLAAPSMGLFLALILWYMYPSSNPSYFLSFGVLLFLCVSSLNVYTTLGAGWSSNSKYALLGALRSVAQTISYEVSMALILMSALIMLFTLNMTDMFNNQMTPLMLLCMPLALVWFTTTLAETNRTPFDFAEGESELVSGFNTEYSSGTFALIFMAEYLNILIMSFFSAIFFMSSPFIPIIHDMLFSMKTLFLAFMFIWIRATLPRMRYDRLMNLTWKGFLPFSLSMLMSIPLLLFFM
uniref:NADH-ubiquinone oxidoreductase chain 1 n=1 Tax=Goniada japonica TaxID=1644143 RepID=A0A0F6QMX1_9ANNE|nr:NADH dehydrogenase subunit 1 [Goniada japonica]AKE32091.1 NADH dehydrogenase subunit 1 [Goniada japonica]